MEPEEQCFWYCLGQSISSIPAAGGLGGTAGAPGAAGVGVLGNPQGLLPSASGAGAAGTNGGNGSGGRVSVTYLSAANIYASSSADGPSSAFAPTGPIAGSGYKQSI